MLLKFPKNLIYFICPMLGYYLSALLLQKFFGLWGISLAQLLCLLPFSLWGMNELNIKQIFFPKAKDITLSLLLTLLVILLLDALMAFQESYFPRPAPMAQQYEYLLQMQTPWEMFSKIFILCLTPALCEEFLFRGFLQSLWKKELGHWGILLSSFLFAISHGNFAYVHFYLMLGLFLASLKEWKQNLWLCVLAHLTNNVWTLLGG